MLIAITNDLIGKRIKLIEMIDEPYPIESGTLGTIYHIGGGILNVKWDNGRTLGVVIDLDNFEIIDNN
jgi:hypothetical protein